MKKYCLDTSGLSTPLETMPEDIHDTAWVKIKECITSGIFAVTMEIYEELTHLTGSVGECIKNNQDALLMEVGEGDWNWEKYTEEVTRMQDDYKAFISDFNGGRKDTICLNDLSIIALAKTLGLPLISMESIVQDEVQSKKRRIPNICNAEKIEHKKFSEFCRLEGLKF